MDSEAKKPQFDEEAKFWQDMDKVDEEDEINPSAGNDEIDREEAMYDMLMEELKEYYYSEKEKIPAGEKWNEWEYEEDTDEDEDEDEFEEICNTKNWCGRV
jgi:hypothetical protein